MKKTAVTVLGAGLVGKPIAWDLSRDADLEVTLIDLMDTSKVFAEEHGIHFRQADLSNNDEVRSVVANADVVVNATPGFMGYAVLREVIRSGVDVVDIAFYPEDPLDLHDLAVEKGVSVICDMGVAPGMSHLLVSYFASFLDEVDRADIYVGGLPRVRTWPWEYKAVFSPADVLEEYTRPARVIENGVITVKKPLSEVEHLEFEELGTLEAFNSDGLRTLLHSVKAANMHEKTLRYPGYAEKISVLADAGFFDSVPRSVNGVLVSPLSLTSELLFDQWKLHPHEEDLTVMRIIVEGSRSGQGYRYESNLFDRYDQQTGIHSMARTTGFAATMALRWLLKQRPEPGITLPEQLGLIPGAVDFILQGLADRNIHYHQKQRRC